MTEPPTIELIYNAGRLVCDGDIAIIERLGYELLQCTLIKFIIHIH